MNCPFFSSYIHELAHTMPARFDKFGDILHTVNKEIPYPATEELVDKPTTIDEVFTLLFTTLDNIKITLNEFIKATDETAHGMACAAETLLNDIESEYPMLFRLQGAWKNCENDVVDFDKFVCQYVERKSSLLESKKKTIIIKEEQSKMKEFNCWLNDEKITTVLAVSEEEALKEFEKYLQENEMSAEGAWVEDANPSIFEQLFPEADFSSKYVVESAGDISEEFYDEYEDLEWPEAEELEEVEEALTEETEDVDLDVEHKYDVATDGLSQLASEAKSNPEALHKLVNVFNNYIGNNKLVDMSYSTSGVGENLKIKEENRYEDEENSFELEEGVDEIFDQATYYLDREAKDDYSNYVEVVNELYDIFKL